MALRAFLMNHNLGRHRERQYRHRVAYMDDFNDSELRARYRFGRESIRYITGLIEDVISRPTRRNHSLDAETQVLIALRYYATGNFMQVIGDTFGLDKSTVSRVIHRVSSLLCSKLNNFVNFPGDLSRIKTGFFSVAGFPGVIGCIDGTHVRIIAPTDNEGDFINRKGYHSINVQAICDHESRFLNVVARWPGSTHDSRIFRESAIGQAFETNPGKGVLLGDAGYACRPFLMTPHQVPQNNPEIQYNISHKKTRCVIERTFGMWKRRFHILHGEIRLSTDRACAVIGACAVLHNIALLMREPTVEGDDGDDDPTLTTPFADREDATRPERRRLRKHAVPPIYPWKRTLTPSQFVRTKRAAFRQEQITPDISDIQQEVVVVTQESMETSVEISVQYKRG